MVGKPHRPPRLQLANLALRNAWFAGGVEWNIGTTGHSVHTCEPIHAAHVTGPHETPVLRMYEFERLRRTLWQVDVYLPDRSATLFVYVRIQNRTTETVPCYWWTNIAVPESSDIRVLAPASSAYHFSPSQMLRKVRLPTPHGTDISYATNSRTSADYFFDIPDDQPPWIAAIDGQGSGLFQASTARLRGRKLLPFGACIKVDGGGRSSFQGSGSRTWRRQASLGRSWSTSPCQRVRPGPGSKRMVG